MDLPQLILAIATGSLTTALGFWLSERAAKSRQWNATKMSVYADFLGAAHDVRGGAGAIKSWGDTLATPTNAPKRSEASEATAAAFGRLTEVHGRVMFVAPADVLDAANVLLIASTALVNARIDGGKPDTDATWAAILAFQKVARTDLGIT